MEKAYWVYIMTNKNHTVLYTGMTGRLGQRMMDHKEKVKPGFTKRYNSTKLVYVETFQNVGDAIAREKQIKAGSRQRKIELINGANPAWDDLSESMEIL